MEVMIDGPRVDYIRTLLKDAYKHREKDEMVEIIGASFIADEPSILRPPNEEYIQRELEWYQSQSLNVNDIPGTPPEIWLSVADPVGHINSNYGHLVYGAENGRQYRHVLKELQRNRSSRRGTMIYTRPTMHTEAVEGGKNDFVCTNVVSYFIRDDSLVAVVQMRSNDAVFGYPNDYAWQRFVQEQLASDLEVPAGVMVWQASSLHVYPRHRHLLEELDI